MAERPFQKFVEKQESEQPLGFEANRDIPAIMIDVELSNGDRLGLPNAYLTAIKLDSSGKLLMTYPALSVVVQGRNLVPLYLHLLAQIVRRIYPAETKTDTGDAVTWISEIRLALPDDPK